jgi:hypothetical protein
VKSAKPSVGKVGEYDLSALLQWLCLREKLMWVPWVTQSG